MRQAGNSILELVVRVEDFLHHAAELAYRRRRRSLQHAGAHTLVHHTRFVLCFGSKRYLYEMCIVTNLCVYIF